MIALQVNNLTVRLKGAPKRGSWRVFSCSTSVHYCDLQALQKVLQPFERRTTWNEPQHIYTTGGASRIAALRSFEKILESLHRNRFLLLEAAFYPCFSIDLKENFHLSALIFTSQRAGTATLRIKASHSLFTLWAVLLLPRSWPSSKHRITLLRNVYRSINQIDYKHK